MASSQGGAGHGTLATLTTLIRIAKAKCLCGGSKGDDDGLDLSSLVQNLSDDIDLLLAGNGCVPNERQVLETTVQQHLTVLVDLTRELTGEEANVKWNVPNIREQGFEVVEQFIAMNLPVRLVELLPLLEYEAKNCIVKVFGVLLRQDLPPVLANTVLENIHHNPEIFQLLMDYFSNPECALFSSAILLACTRHEALADAMLQGNLAVDLTKIGQQASFETSMDVFGNLRGLLLTSKKVSAAWLEANFGVFFRNYKGLLESNEYVVLRQSLKLLSEALLDRAFVRVMLKYVKTEMFFKIHMQLLKNESQVVRLETFHVLKLFIANPKKPPRIQTLLYKNKAGLLRCIATLKEYKFKTEEEEKQFEKDYTAVVGKLTTLEPPQIKAPTKLLKHDHPQSDMWSCLSTASGNSVASF